MSSPTPPPPMPPSLARPLPYDVVNARLVENLTPQGLRDAGIAPADSSLLSIGLTLSLDANGTKFSSATLWLWGAPKTLTSNPGLLYPPAKTSGASMVVRINPRDMLFRANTAFTPWKDGQTAVKAKEIVFNGTDKDKEMVKKLKDLEFSFRWSVQTVRNFQMAKLVLQLLPVPFEALENIIDSLSPDLKVISIPLESADWAAVPNPVFQMMGPLPAILDLRNDEASALGALPTSWETKSYVRAFCMGLTASPTLTEAEVGELGSDYSKNFRAAPAPSQWPPLNAEMPVEEHIEPQKTGEPATAADVPPFTFGTFGQPSSFVPQGSCSVTPTPR